MIRILALGFTMLTLSACSPFSRQDHETALPDLAPTFLDPLANISLVLPEDWQIHQEGAAYVLHGPDGSDSMYATLALQHKPAYPETKLDEFMAHSFAEVSHQTGFVWDNLAVGFAGTSLALGYGIRFLHLETMHCQYGWLFVHQRTLTSLTLTAPQTLCEQMIPVFQNALDTLTLLPDEAR